MPRAGPQLFPALAAALLLTGLSGCMVLPVTTQHYDPECRVMTRQMELQPIQLYGLGHCASRECGALLAIAGATAAASLVVSGSIVVVGNVAYWLERQGRCFAGPDESLPAPAGP